MPPKFTDLRGADASEKLASHMRVVEARGEKEMEKDLV